MSPAARIAALGLALIALAAAFAVSPLYVPGVTLLALALLAELDVRLAARGAAVTLELSGECVEEGSPVPLRVRAGGWAFAVSRGELRALPNGEWRPVPLRGASQQLILQPARRGEHRVGPASARFYDPFGICRRELRSQTRSILVLPRVEPVHRAQLEQVLGLGRARALRDDGPDVEGLRPYRLGAPASRIHWLTVARVGQLVERRAELETDDMPAMIVLDASSPDSAEALDMAVRAAASLCVAIASIDGCSLLLPGLQEAQAIRPDLASWPSLHARLARIAPGARPVWAVAERARAVIWVGARRAHAERASAGIVCCTVSPLRREDRPTLFDLAGCSVQPAAAAVASAA